MSPYRRSSTDARRNQLFQDATAVIRSDFARPLTLEAAAARIAASPRQVRRAFSEVGGTTFRAYLRDVRMARAAEFLGSSDLPVREVAARVGYRQPSQFTKAFKLAFGLTPSRFRGTGVAGALRPISPNRRIGEA